MFSNVIYRRIFGGLAALLGALFAVAINIPLPWLLGPLFTVAALRLLSAPIATYKPLRNVGQWIIGLSLGLYFSPEIARLVGTHWVVLLVGTGLSLVLAACGTWLLHRVGRVDVKTAWFASAIGGASEMSILAERYGARVDLVASAHSLRVLAVVTIIPFGFEALGILGSDDSFMSETPFNLVNALIVAIAAILVGSWFYKMQIASAWILGPLAAAGCLTLVGYTPTSLPSWVVNIGQLFLGWAIGDRYRPAFFKAAPRFLTAVVLYSIGAICLVAAIGWVASMLSVLSLPTIWLGMAPGGLAEMSITAKVLMLGVPMVTALQVCRMTFVVITAGWIYKKIIEPRYVKDTPVEPR
jgi:membrane AbrB-like protein